MATPLIAASMIQRLVSVPLMEWLLWLGSLALSIGLVVVLWSRWGQSKPLQKCAVLSLLVHALLACLAMTIRVVIGDGGGSGGGTPIRVRLVNDVDVDLSTGPPPGAVTDESVLAPALFEPPKEEDNGSDPPEEEPAKSELLDVGGSSVEPAQIEQAEPVPPSEETAPPPEIGPSSQPMVDGDKTAPPVPNPDTSVRSTHDRAAEDIAADPAAVEASTQTASPPPSGEPPATATVSDTQSQAVAAPYALRGAPGRLGLVELQGGSAETEAAVAAALAWLANAQSADGRWDANQFGAGQEQAVLGHDRGGAGLNADTGVSALALLALFGAGHSHEQGDYRLTVRRGLEFLMRSQAADGNLFGQSTFYAQMYCHSMATFALAEAQAMTDDSSLKPAIVKAVDFSRRSQHPATGGWRYKPGDTGDTSQLGWQMMALASAERAGIEVAGHTWMRVGRFLKSVRRGAHGGLAGYRPDGPATTSMTAEALYCRQLLHEMGYESLDEHAAGEATRQLLAAPPHASRVNLYYWYYATLALHHRQHANDAAQAAWQTWNDGLTAALIKTQVADGPNAGSWNTTTVWGGYGGRVYTTAMAAMCLEVYYRYAPSRPPQPGRWTAAPADERSTSR
jgi:hypothetical protein